MSQWLEAQQMTGPGLEQLKRLYGAHFPIEVRHYLAHWIESQPWGDINPDNPSDQYQANLLFEGMLQALQEYLVQNNDNFIMRTQLEGLYLHMKMSYSNKTLDLVRIVQIFLQKERELLDKMKTMQMADSGSSQVPVGPEQIVQRKLEQLKQRSEELVTFQRQRHVSFEQAVLKHNENLKWLGQLQEAMKRPTPSTNLADTQRHLQQLDSQIRKDVEGQQQQQKDMDTKYRSFLEELKVLQEQVLDEMLDGWKARQKSFKSDDSMQQKALNQIQKCCEMLAEMLWTLRQMLRQHEFLHQQVAANLSGTPVVPNQSLATQMHKFATAQLQTLVKRSFVLDREPPQVLKTANRFSATARVLVGSKLSIHMNSPEVVVSIINEQQARQVHNDPEKRIDPSFNSGELLNNKKVMEVQKTDRLTCTFNLQLKRIKRSQDRRGHESVMEEKFTLLFQSVLNLGGELSVPVKVMSLPTVVIVHGNQQPQAEFTIFWDNSFAEVNRQPFVTRDVVLWSELAQALTNFFACGTGRGLTQDNLRFLAYKLIPNLGSDTDPAECKVTRQAVGKDLLKMKDTQFTFWSWFYQARELVISCLRQEWEAGLIEGFIDRSNAHEKLKMCQSGTFLARFSEHSCGAISVTYIQGTDSFTPPEVYSVQPCTKTDLINIHPFSNRIRDLQELLFLYPNVSKHEAFAKFYSQQQPQAVQGGYLGVTVQMKINNPSSSTSSAGSMISGMPPSPGDVFLNSPLNPPTPFSGVGSPIDPHPSMHDMQDFPQPPGGTQSLLPFGQSFP